MIDGEGAADSTARCYATIVQGWPTPEHPWAVWLKWRCYEWSSVRYCHSAAWTHRPRPLSRRLPDDSIRSRSRDTYAPCYCHDGHNRQQQQHRRRPAKRQRVTLKVAFCGSWNVTSLQHRPRSLGWSQTIWCHNGNGNRFSKMVIDFDVLTFYSTLHAQRRPAQCSCIIAWNDPSWRLWRHYTGIGISTRYRWRSKVSVSVVSVNSGISLSLKNLLQPPPLLQLRSPGGACSV